MDFFSTEKPSFSGVWIQARNGNPFILYVKLSQSMKAVLDGIEDAVFLYCLQGIPQAQVSCQVQCPKMVDHQQHSDFGNLAKRGEKLSVARRPYPRQLGCFFVDRARHHGIQLLLETEGDRRADEL
jgi:hypothetical protein